MNRPGFNIIVFTSPEPVYDEAYKLRSLLDAGVDYIHVRKPDYEESQVRNLLLDIPPCDRDRLVLHDMYHLAGELSVGGLHLNSRHPELSDTGEALDIMMKTNPELRISKSLHSLDTIDCEYDNRFAYCTLSPIFDSISKRGYSSRFDIDAVACNIIGKRIIALGGVTPDYFEKLRDRNFYGAALLGYIWGDDFTSSLDKLTEALKRIK